MTGLESLLGQALTLDDEPTLVRAVKAVKRSMAKDKRLHQAYVNIAISTLATVILAVATKFSRFRNGLSSAYFIWGIGRIVSNYHQVTTFLTGIPAITFGVMMGLPVSGLVIPYHRALLQFYDPRIQTVLQITGVVLLVGILARDIVILFAIRIDRRRKAEEEERKRQEKIKGIFFTKPVGTRDVATSGRGASLWNGSGKVTDGRRDGGSSKSKSMFSTVRH